MVVCNVPASVLESKKEKTDPVCKELTVKWARRQFFFSFLGKILNEGSENNSTNTHLLTTQTYKFCHIHVVSPQAKNQTNKTNITAGQGLLMTLDFQAGDSATFPFRKLLD